MYGLRHPDATRELMLMGVTGSALLAKRLPEMYHGLFIDITEEGGIAAICETDTWRERIESDTANHEKLMAMEGAEFISTLSKWKELFEARANLPVMGVTEEHLGSLRCRRS